MRSLIAAVLTYIAVCLYMGLSLPGLQYDEAIFEHGAVAMITGDRSPDFGIVERTWAPLFGRRFPLMVIEYAGAAKHYLLAIPFALFGTAPAVGRTISMLLGAIGIFGIGRALGGPVGAAAAFVLAVHPEYVSWTIYDNGGTALWMASCGLVAIALSRLVRRGDRSSAFLLGVAIGFALWGRANFFWIVTGLAAAWLITVRKPVHLPSLAAGGLVGGAPLMVYELFSRFATLQFTPRAGGARIEYVLSALAYDGERAGMWGGSAPPQWQLIAFGVLVALSLLVAPRWASIAAVVTYAFAFLTPLHVNPHHFAALLPLPVIVVCLAAARLWRRTRIAVLLLCAAYAAFAFHWNRAAHEGLAATHGVDMWSDAITGVSRVLESKRRPVAIVDWGLANNLYVLSRGTVPFREVFWRPDTAWTPLVSQGGLFLLNAPGNTHFTQAAAGFSRALEETGARYSVTTFRQRNGAEYARLYDVEPGGMSRLIDGKN